MTPDKAPPPIIGFSVLCRKELTAVCERYGPANQKKRWAKREIAFRGTVQLAALVPDSLKKYPQHAARFHAFLSEDPDVCIAAMQVFRRAVYAPKTAKDACCAMLTLNWIGDIKPAAYMEGWRKNDLRPPPEVETMAHTCAPSLLWSEGVRVPYCATTALETSIQEMRDLWAREWHRRYGSTGDEWTDAQLRDPAAPKVNKDHASRVHKLRQSS